MLILNQANHDLAAPALDGIVCQPAGTAPKEEVQAQGILCSFFVISKSLLTFNYENIFIKNELRDLTNRKLSAIIAVVKGTAIFK